MTTNCWIKPVRGLYPSNEQPGTTQSCTVKHHHHYFKKQSPLIYTSILCLPGVPVTYSWVLSSEPAGWKQQEFCPSLILIQFNFKPDVDYFFSSSSCSVRGLVVVSILLQESECLCITVGQNNMLKRSPCALRTCRSYSDQFLCDSDKSTETSSSSSVSGCSFVPPGRVFKCLISATSPTVLKGFLDWKWF